jgi:hypothetical protein
MQRPRRTRTHLLGALVLLSSTALAAASTVVDVAQAGPTTGVAAAVPWFVRFCVAQPPCNPSTAEAWDRQTQHV